MVLRLNILYYMWSMPEMTKNQKLILRIDKINVENEIWASTNFKTGKAKSTQKFWYIHRLVPSSSSSRHSRIESFNYSYCFRWENVYLCSHTKVVKSICIAQLWWLNDAVVRNVIHDITCRIYNRVNYQIGFENQSASI